MRDSDDLVKRAEATEQAAGRIELVPEQRARERRVMLCLLVLILIAQAIGLWSIERRVEGQIEVLQERNLELVVEAEQRDAIIAEAAVFIGDLAVETVEHGGDPGLLQLDGVQGGPVDRPPGGTTATTSGE